MTTSQELFDQAKTLEERVVELRAQASKLRIEELQAQPIEDRLVYAASARCACGAGLAYDPAGESGRPASGYFDCSAILLDHADQAVKHEARLPFVFYEIRTERQPSAHGATTRPEPQNVA